MNTMDFTISEFNISGEPILEDVADKILEHHIVPMQKVRDKYGAPIWPSQKSGYRSVQWEKSRGRSGNSQHTFKGKGAVDWTASDLDKLEKLIIEHTDYTRIARYNTFIHCDYKAKGERQYFKSDSRSRWTFINNV